MAQISKSTRFLKNSKLKLFSGFGSFKKKFLLMAEKSSAINKIFFLKVPKLLKSLSLEFFKNLVDFEI